VNKVFLGQMAYQIFPVLKETMAAKEFRVNPDRRAIPDLAG
jgi:hypothetical protein